MALPFAASTTACSPGAKSLSGVAPVSISLEYSQRWPAFSRRSAFFLRRSERRAVIGNLVIDVEMGRATSSALAPGTEDAGTLPQGHQTQLGATASAGLTVAAIHIEPLGEVPRLAGAADKIPQRRSPLRDRGGQHLSDGIGQARITLARDATRFTARRYPPGTGPRRHRCCRRRPPRRYPSGRA